jgi:hypothetical protein
LQSNHTRTLLPLPWLICEVTLGVGISNHLWRRQVAETLLDAAPAVLAKWDPFVALDAFNQRQPRPQPPGTVSHPASPHDLMSVFISRGVDVGRRGEGGITLLHIVKDGATARALVQAGVDPSARDSEGRTPLHTARSSDVVRELIAAGG